MKISAPVSIEEYLSTSYDPDCEYLAGRLVERNVGDVDHSDVQTSLATYLRANFRTSRPSGRASRSGCR